MAAAGLALAVRRLYGEGRLGQAGRRGRRLAAVCIFLIFITDLRLLSWSRGAQPARVEAISRSLAGCFPAPPLRDAWS